MAAGGEAISTGDSGCQPQNEQQGESRGYSWPHSGLPHNASSVWQSGHCPLARGNGGIAQRTFMLRLCHYRDSLDLPSKSQTMRTPRSSARVRRNIDFRRETRNSSGVFARQLPPRTTRASPPRPSADLDRRAGCRGEHKRWRSTRQRCPARRSGPRRWPAGVGGRGAIRGKHGMPYVHVFVAPPEGPSGAGPCHVFPFCLDGQPIATAVQALQPGTEDFRIVVADLDGRQIVVNFAAPKLAGERSVLAEFGESRVVIGRRIFQESPNHVRWSRER